MRIALANFTRPACRGRRAGMLLASAALVFTAVFVFSSGAAAAASVRTQQKKAAASAAVATRTAAPAQAKAVAAKSAESAPKGTNTGITVHGHWVINVLTPAGKLVYHTEFENSLLSSGKVALAAILNQTDTMGAWGISFAGTATPCTALNTSNILGKGTGCVILQGAAAGTVCNSTGCLAGMSAPSNTPPTVILSGSLALPTNSSGGNITQVETIMGACGTNISTATCVPGIAGGGEADLDFTSAILGTAGEPPVVPVAAGQIVQITVTFSFS